MNGAIEVKNLCKGYPNFSLKDVSFSVPKGSIVGMIGENGAGKSTVIKAVLDLITIDSGSVRVLGEEAGELPSEEKENVGVILDDSVFYENMSARELERIFQLVYQKWDRWYFLTC